MIDNTSAASDSPTADESNGVPASTLFRMQVVQVRREGWLGSLSLSQPIRMQVYAWVAVGLALMVMAVLIFGSYTRRERVQGRLVPVEGLADVIAVEAGVVSSLAVAEGQRVRRGQPLAMVVMPSTTAQGSTLTALQEGIGSRQQALRDGMEAGDALQRLERSSLADQIRAKQNELRQIADEMALRRRQVEIARDTLGRMQQLLDDRYVSNLQARQQESVVIDGEAAMQALQRQATTVQKEREQLQSTLLALEPQRDVRRADAALRLQELDAQRIETVARGEQSVQSPLAGVVANLQVKAGQSVGAGQVLASVIPGDGRLEVELQVPSRGVGFIAPGDGVLLRYDAYPYQKFGHQRGKVKQISRSAQNAAMPGPGAATLAVGETFYRVTVELERQNVLAYGRQEALRPGMLLEADILGERRRLIEWVLEPLYSVKGRNGE